MLCCLTLRVAICFRWIIVSTFNVMRHYPIDVLLCLVRVVLHSWTLSNRRYKKESFIYISIWVSSLLGNLCCSNFVWLVFSTTDLVLKSFMILNWFNCKRYSIIDGQLGYRQKIFNVKQCTKGVRIRTWVCFLYYCDFWPGFDASKTTRHLTFCNNLFWLLWPYIYSICPLLCMISVTY